jgi:hypothetical protein
MELTEKDKIVKGFKATDENMCCMGFQFTLGEWHKHDGDIELCKKGFHFCEYPSGPWLYYEQGRLFEIEAKMVLLTHGPGVGLKHVCREIRLVKEITPSDRNTGDLNTGHWNAGNRNTGNQNTGNQNTGNQNTGNQNAGHWNTGDRNTGHWNAGNKNTGDLNTGHRNAGHKNTGDRNAGNRNTGHWNTGNRNTGVGNCGDRHTGCLNYGEPVFFIFNKPASIHDVDSGLVDDLSRKLMGEDDIDPEPFLSLPNATKEAIKKLHNEHKKRRRNG